MGFNLADLIVEATIRDGLLYLAQNPSRVDELFAPLLKSYASRKYGQAEIDKIKTMLQEKHIAIVHSFHLAEAKAPCYSIQLGAENEAKERAHLGDFESQIQVPIADQSTLVRVPNFVPTGYDITSGRITVADSVNLNPVHAGYIFVDAGGNEHEVQRGISNEIGNKFFFLPKNGNAPNISGNCFIKTFLSYTQHEEKGYSSSVNLLIGVHSKEPLMTKYLYVILKHIMASRKHALIKRGLINSTFSASDFTRDLRYEGDHVFTRFFTLTGQVDDTWHSDETVLIDNVEIDATPGDIDQDES